ncbi:MAG TPA: hypothetical protein VM187_00385 [Niastella sp.]|nr:hypothetical protein [Niastella sp.]
MKSGLLLAALLSSSSLWAQVSNVQLKGALAETAKLGRIQGGEGLPQFSSNNIKGTRYLFQNWSSGVVTTVNNTTETGYLLMFDKENNDIYARRKNSDTVILVFKDQVKNFELNNTVFVRGTQIESGDPDLFYQALAGSKDSIMFYKSIKTKFVKADKHDAERIKKGDFDDAYQDEVSYFIKQPNQPLQKINLTQRSLVKVIPAKAQQIKAYFRTRIAEEENESVVAKLIAGLEP